MKINDNLLSISFNISNYLKLHVLIAFIFLIGVLNAGEEKAEISISGAWALYPMAIKWALEYKKINPDIKFDIAAGGAGKGMADAIAGIIDLGMVSRSINKAEIEKGAWWISVTKDAVVPVCNTQNPYINDILTKGMTKEKFKDIWISGEITLWSQIFIGQPEQDINVYTRSDACGAAETWALFLDNKQEDLLGTGVYGDPGLADAVIKDIFGIG
ncbi:MAG: hypothetical protein ACD_79C00473G0006 [uncultured bacterium]|nr:MAG: hypothetical protein ACD_79C00473G0006 [uncultured bacterium]